MNFAIASKNDFGHFLGDVGFKADDEEVNVVIRSDDGSKYKMTEKFRYGVMVIIIILSYL